MVLCFPCYDKPLPLQRSVIQFKTYTNEKLSVLGQHNVTVRYGDQVQKLMFTVVDGDGPSLLGRDWLKKTMSKLDPNFHGSKSSTQLEDLMKEYSKKNRDKLGTIRGVQKLPCPDQNQCHLQYEMPLGMNLITLK